MNLHSTLTAMTLCILNFGLGTGSARNQGGARNFVVFRNTMVGVCFGLEVVCRSKTMGATC